MNRRRILLAGLAMPGFLSIAQAKDTHLPRPKSLALVAQQAQSRGEPLVLLVSLPGCPYCELVRRNYLKPMREQEGLAAWQIDIRDKAPLTGFDGQATTPLAVARQWQIKVTPTVLFLDAQGREVAPRLEGVAVVDFYGSYLEERLNQSRQTLAASKS
ncbi:MAG: hypothetical protein RLZZ271_567 [Pseudomonadota bacterium]